MLLITWCFVRLIDKIIDKIIAGTHENLNWLKKNILENFIVHLEFPESYLWFMHVSQSKFSLELTLERK